MPPAAVRSAAEDFCLWRPSEPSVAAMRRAWYWCDQAKLDYWDGLILATAEQAGCHYLLSEDFQPGKHYGTVTVVNPFEHEPAEFGFS
jgi:predicted nucleic acid-binding protein